jgi:hypothetical protein
MLRLLKSALISLNTCAHTAEIASKTADTNHPDAIDWQAFEAHVRSRFPPAVRAIFFTHLVYTQKKCACTRRKNIGGLYAKSGYAAAVAGVAGSAFCGS